jgi:hypothetical protein
MAGYSLRADSSMAMGMEEGDVVLGTEAEGCEGV